MLTFFRRIRKSLLESGSAHKYFPYAIGEVLLVMIGILLALQVNNWNEGLKSRNLELKLLSELKAGLLADKNGIIESRINRSLKYMNYVDNLLLLLDNNLP